MAQFVSYSGPGNTPIYYQPTLFSPEPPFGGLYGYGMWQKVNNVGQPTTEKPKDKSMVEQYYSNLQPFQQFAAQQAPLNTLGYNPSMANLYSPATSNLYSTGSSLLSPSTSGNYYGAGRFLNTGNLLGFNFTPSQTAATTSNP